ncbi:MAG: hypothetical protein LBR73_01270 [Oscillospiraceae bacterium]|jgi:hypothetical protein|nr:hypothetical protein [Oscillospiraceae bacterium]
MPLALNIDLNSVTYPFLRHIAQGPADGAEAALLPFVAQYAGSGVTDVCICVFCQHSASPSAVFTDACAKYAQTSEDGHPVDYKAIFYGYKQLADWGIDAYTVWFRELRRQGLRAWLSVRMNDCHNPDDPTDELRSDFFYEARRNGWMLGADWGYYRNCFDYAVPEVRAKMLAYIREQLLRYDVDGIELDFLREIHCFPSEGNPDNIRCMNAFLSEVHEICREAQRRRGHAVRVSVRLPRDITQAEMFGFDATAWAKAGHVDCVTVSPRWETNDSDMPIDVWKAALSPYGVSVWAGLEILNCRCSADESTYTHAQTVRGLAAQYLDRGADGLYLYNYYRCPVDIPSGQLLPDAALSEIYRTATDAQSLSTLPRRHIVTKQDLSPRGIAPWKPLPAALPFELVLHTGALPPQAPLLLFLSTDTEVMLTVTMNGMPCVPANAYLPEQGLNRYPPPGTVLYAFAAPASCAGRQTVAVTADSPDTRIVYAELFVGASERLS